MSRPTPPNALPGLWREFAGPCHLVRLDTPAVTPGMVVVAKHNEPWTTHPELRWQVWPDDLQPNIPVAVQATGKRLYMACHLRAPVGEWRVICDDSSRATSCRPPVFSHIWQRKANGGMQ